MEVVRVNPSYPLKKALTFNSQDATPLRYPDVVASAPNDPAQAGGDGYWKMGEGGIVTAERLVIFPYAEAPEDTTFWMRLFGWRAATPNDNATPVLWLPHLLVEIQCVCGNLPGPLQGPQYLSPWENLSKAIMVTDGSLGQYGDLRNTNAGLTPAWLMVDIAGARMVQFQFQRLETDTVTMNALWARA